MFIISVNVVDYYDWAHHTIMARVFLSLGFKMDTIAAMLQSIQLMKFFLNIKSSLRNIKTTMVTTFEYGWMELHQDRYKLWHQLSLAQQLNCPYEILAKRVVADSLDPSSQTIGKQVLPRESAGIF